MDERVKALEAELAVARLEAEFVKAKANGDLTPDIRANLEKTRREYREKWRIPTGVQPATVKAVAKNKATGG